MCSKPVAIAVNGPDAAPSAPAGPPSPPAAAPAEMAISVRGVSKCYEIYDRPIDRLKQTLWRGRRRFYREFWAVRDISFDVRRGEAIGIIGRNGSGKSTILQIIAGTLRPTEGEVEVHGRVAALLELGSGFNPEFTGRENAFLNGAILGLSRDQVAERFDQIASFADIGEFIDMPVKTYSTGMLVRLAFAVQVQLEPDILIVDEALAVGDALFQKRCFQKLEEMRGRGLTLVFVSHDQESVRSFTSCAILLDQGQMRAQGSPAEVVLEYRRLLHEYERQYYSHLMEQKSIAAPTPPPSNGATRRSDALSFGDFDAVIESVEVLDASERPASVFYPGQRMIIRVRSRVARDLTHLNVAVRIRSKEGVKIYSWGTLNQDIAIWSGRAAGEVFWERPFAAGDVVTVDFECDCVLGVNFYEVQACIAEARDRYYVDQRMLHWRDEAAFFQVCMVNHEYFFGGTCDLKMKSRLLPGPGR